MSDTIIYSRSELANPDFVRPVMPMSHLPNTAEFSFVLALMGIEELVPAATHDDLSAVSVVSAPLAGEEGIIFSTHAYNTAAEAIAIGDAFPAHAVYAELDERWAAELESVTNPNTARTGLAVARLALTGVYVFGPISRLQELQACPTYEDARLTRPDAQRFRYVFAQGNSAAPLIERRPMAELWHGDLSVPDYSAFRRILHEHSEALNVDVALEQVDLLEIAHSMPPTASEEDLRFARSVAIKIATEESNLIPEGRAREDYYKAIYNRIMEQIFGESYAGDPGI